MPLASALRSRLLAVVLLLASPGAGGMLLPVLHPCPVDQPWAVGGRQAQTHEHSHHHGDDGSRPEHKHCQCIGSCEDAASPHPESALADGVFLLPVARVLGTDSGARAPLPAPRNLHPPSTAPPQV
jgi:hypothetical protein